MTAVVEARAVVARPRAERAEREARAQRAWEALAHAERRTGARSVRTAPVTAAVAAPAPATSFTPAAVAAPALVPVPSAVPAPAPAPTSPPARPALITTERPSMAVPPALEPLLPDGLRRGGTTVVAGSTSLVLTLLARACAHGAWAAVVGVPDLGVLAAAQAGVDLDRLAMVPSPGPDAPAVLAALLDGLDVVVVGPGATLADADRRRLMARARDRGSVLLPTYAWPGAGATLLVEDGGWAGVGVGDGWLRAHRLRVVRTGRGVGAARAVDVVLPLGAAPDEPVVPAASVTSVASDERAWPHVAVPDEPAMPHVVAAPDERSFTDALGTPDAPAGAEVPADRPELRLVG